MTCLFFFQQKTAYEVRISDWSSDVCSSDLHSPRAWPTPAPTGQARGQAMRAHPALPRWDRSTIQCEPLRGQRAHQVVRYGAAPNARLLPDLRSRADWRSLYGADPAPFTDNRTSGGLA